LFSIILSAKLKSLHLFTHNLTFVSNLITDEKQLLAEERKHFQIMTDKNLASRVTKKILQPYISKNHVLSPEAGDFVQNLAGATA